MKIGIIGGGMMGICLGYFLSQMGISVEIFEASSILGGLAKPILLDDGTKIDRFYHAILSSDKHLINLCKELKIDDQLRFHETKMGFYYKNQIYSMNSVIEFLRFPPLGWIDRFRLGITVLYAQFIQNWNYLESVSVEKWLTNLGGKHTYENIWLPMLNAKFDGGFDQIPATYIWARLVRMKSTRSGANQKEQAGHLVGGYSTLIQEMANQIEKAGNKIHLQKPISEIVIKQNIAQGVVIDNDFHPFDFVISTLPPPIFQKQIPDASKEYQEFLLKTKYMGIICPILVLDRPLTGYWTLNLTDSRIPFTGIIETTSYIDPQYVGGHHLVYLPKYTAPENPLQNMTDEQIKNIWLDHLTSMFPNFELKWVRYLLIQREKYVEPLHLLNSVHLIPPTNTPVKNLYLATNSQIYPALTNGESICQKAQEIAEIISHQMK